MGIEPDGLDIALANGQGIEVHEHETALGLADELLSGGTGPSASSATYVLAEFAKSNPRRAVDPWLRLLEVYRNAGAQDEYETIARGLNRHFNVRPPVWDADEVGDDPAGIELYPHVVERIVTQWGSRACRDYLGNLLIDNRGGSRSGFGIHALSDILLLADILDAVDSATSRVSKAARQAATQRCAA